MASFRNWLSGLFSDPLEPVSEHHVAAALTMAARGIIVNPEHGIHVRHANERIGQIQHYLAEQEVIGAPVSDKKMEEFRQEIRGHALLLHKERAIDESGHNDLLRSVGAA